MSMAEMSTLHSALKTRSQSSSLQTTGKTLKEIDLIFAKDSIKHSDLAVEVLAHHDLAEKATVTMVEKV